MEYGTRREFDLSRCVSLPSTSTQESQSSGCSAGWISFRVGFGGQEGNHIASVV